jgi:hypothetical protein
MIRDIFAWCQTGRQFPGLKRFDDPDARAMLEARQVLDHAGLPMRTVVNRQGGARTQIGLTGWACTHSGPTPCVSISDSRTPHHRFQTDPLPGFVVGLRYLGESHERARPLTGDTKKPPPDCSSPSSPVHRDWLSNRPIVGRSYRSIRRNEMSAMFAGVAFTVVFSIPALVREIRLARRYESPAAVRPGPQLASR